VEPPLPDPESDPEPESNPEPEPDNPDPELEEDEELDPDPELPAASADPELDAEVMDAPLSGPESARLPAPPSGLHGFSLDDPDDPQATRKDMAAIGKRRRGWAARFITSAVAAGGVTRHEYRGHSGRGG
jgi:hypothetical protein